MNFNDELFKIGRFFADKFGDAYSYVKRSGKTKVLEYFYSVYRKWYYSAFFDENILTPGNLVYRLNDKADDGNYYVPVMKIKSKSRYSGFEVRILNYTADNHPIVEDLKIFADNIDVININNDGIVYNDDITKVLNKISMDDKLYLEYLLYIGTEIKVFKKMPSIYSEVYSLGKNYPSFFEENDKRTCFKKIVDAAINVSVRMINEFFPDEQQFFSSEYIRNIIKNPVYIEDIFKEIYHYVGICIEDIWQYEEEYENGEIGEFADAVLSSAYFLRILMDKWFVTPFGDYLKLIMPIYFYSYNFSEKMNGIIEESQICGFEFSSSIYYPCSKYSLTPLARDFFGIERTVDEYDKIFEKFPVSVIIDAIILGDAENSLFNMASEIKETSEIYELKVKFEDRKDFWKVIEVDENTTLTMLHLEICKEMNLYPFGEYSFFTDQNKSPFSEYTPKTRQKRSNKKTETTKISELELSPKQKFIYRNCLESNMEFIIEGGKVDIFIEIEFMKAKEKNKNYSYPRVTRISSLAKMAEEDLEF